MSTKIANKIEVNGVLLAYANDMGSLVRLSELSGNPESFVLMTDKGVDRKVKHKLRNLIEKEVIVSGKIRTIAGTLVIMVSHVEKNKQEENDEDD